MGEIAKNLYAKYIACERAFVHYGSTMFHVMRVYMLRYFFILCPLFSVSFFSYLFGCYHF